MSNARHHAEWLSLLEVSGPFLSLPVLTHVFPQGLEAHDPDIYKNVKLAFEEWQQSVVGKSYGPIHQAWISFVLQEVLGYTDEVLRSSQGLPPGLEAHIAEHGETLRPDMAVVNR